MTRERKPDRQPQEQSASSVSGGRSPGRVDDGPDHEERADASSGEAASKESDPAILAKLEAENAELKDRLLRALAEVENIRRRAERDVNDARQYAIAKFAGDILGVADNLGRALASIPAKARQGDPTVNTLVEGVELTEKSLLGAMEKHGVRKLDPVGERFDPNFHEALFEVPDASVPRGTVARVVEPGYAIGSRPLRPAKVGIATGG